MLSNYTEIHIASSQIYGPIPFSRKYVAKPSTKDIRKLNANIGEPVLGNNLRYKGIYFGYHNCTLIAKFKVKETVHWTI